MATTPRIPRTSMGMPGLPATPGTLPRPRKSLAGPSATTAATPTRTPRSARLSPSIDLRPPPLPDIPPHHARSASNTEAADYAQRSASAMSHRSASSAAASRPASAMSTASSRRVTAAHAHSTPSRPTSRPASALSSRPASALDNHSSARSVKARSLALLEQMDLNGRAGDDDDEERDHGNGVDAEATPRKANGVSSGGLRSASRSSEVTGAVAEPVVPLRVYEELYADLTTRDERIATLEQQLRHAQSNIDSHTSSALEQERHRLRQEATTHQKLLDEERDTERQDEKRRRGEIESREAVLRGELDSLKREHTKRGEEVTKLQGANAELQTRVDENERLIAQLKESVNADSVKDAEIAQLKSRVERLDAERVQLQEEIEELKEAGQETIT